MPKSIEEVLYRNWGFAMMMDLDSGLAMIANLEIVMQRWLSWPVLLSCKTSCCEVNDLAWSVGSGNVILPFLWDFLFIKRLDFACVHYLALMFQPWCFVTVDCNAKSKLKAGFDASETPKLVPNMCSLGHAVLCSWIALNCRCWIGSVSHHGNSETWFGQTKKFRCTSQSTKRSA